METIIRYVNDKGERVIQRWAKLGKNPTRAKFIFKTIWAGIQLLAAIVILAVCWLVIVIKTLFVRAYILYAGVRNWAMLTAMKPKE